MYVCLCKGLTESDVRRAGQVGAVSPCQLIEFFGLKENDCCGRCAKNIHEFEDLVNAPIRTPCRNLPLR